MRHEWKWPNRYTGELESCVATDGKDDTPETDEEWAYYGFADKDDPVASEIVRLAERVRELEAAAASEERFQRCFDITGFTLRAYAVACVGCGEMLRPRGEVTASPEPAGRVIYVPPCKNCSHHQPIQEKR